MVQRPNVPVVRGTAAIREFFFGLLESGMSEVELEPQRTELFGDFGYEAGRCKSLVPVAMGKRREERGKYLVLLSRQANGEWKIVADSWSSDLSLSGSAEGLAKAVRRPRTRFPARRESRNQFRRSENVCSGPGMTVSNSLGTPSNLGNLPRPNLGL